MAMQGESRSNARYWVLFLLFLVNVLNLFDRHVINILAQDIKTELDISDTQLGLLTGTAFGIFYSILGIPLGRVADRVNRFRLIAAAVSLWSVFTLLSGLANNFLQLFLARVGVGVGEAGSQPASTTLVTDFFPKQSRVAAMSFLMLGAPVGSFLGMYLGGLAGSLWGWRTAFILAGLPGLLLALVILLTLRDPRLQAGKRPEPPDLRTSLYILWSNRQLRFIAVFISCATFAIYASGAWLPAFFIRVQGVATSEIGIYTGVAIGLGGGAGVLGGGFLCDILRNRVRQIEIVVLAVSTLFTIPCLMITLFAEQLMIAVYAMAAFFLFAFVYLSPAITLIQQQVPPETRAFAVAICISIANIVSLIFGLPLVGFISDTLAPTSGTLAISYALALCLLSTTGVGLYYLKRFFKAEAS